MRRSVFSTPAPWRAAVLLFLVISTTDCHSTHFPEDPAVHPLWEELQDAPHEYYFLVRTGVRSRVLGILPDEKRQEQLMRIRRRWTSINRWETTPALLDYLRSHGLNPVAERVKAALTANAPNAPPDGIEEHIETGAVKVGLLEAYHELEQGGDGESGRR